MVRQVRRDSRRIASEEGWETVLQSGDQFGYDVAAIGVWNQDGLNDILVGTPFADLGASSAGVAYLQALDFCGIFVDDPVVYHSPDDDGTRGAIVNMASAAAFDGQIGQAAYSASKGGIVGMTLPIARDLSAIGVRVNTIAPGLIDTPIYGEGEASDQFKAHLGQSVLFPKRLGYGEELAFMVMDLITNPYMNAEVVRVDGGIRMPPK